METQFRVNTMLRNFNNDEHYSHMGIKIPFNQHIDQYDGENVIYLDLFCKYISLFILFQTNVTWFF